MEAKIKRELKEKVMAQSEAFNLEEIIINSYIRQFDEKT